MGYPVMYRRASAFVRDMRGFQPPVNSAARYIARPRMRPAANMNMPRPANDNVPMSSADMVRFTLDFLGPYGRAAAFAWDLFDWWNMEDPWGQRKPGATVLLPGDYDDCGNHCGGTPDLWDGFSSGTCASNWVCNPWPGWCDVCAHTGAGGNPFPITAAWQRILLYVSDATGKKNWGTFIKKAGGTQVPYWSNEPGPYAPVESPYAPSWDPMSVPMKNPARERSPFPYNLVPSRQPNPGRSPVEQTWRGPEAAPRYKPSPAPYFIPWNEPGVATPIAVPIPLGPGVEGQPGPTIIIDKPGPVTLAPPSRGARPRRPGRYVRERKTVLGVGGTIARVVNVVSEGRDVVQAIWYAVPYKLRTKKKHGRGLTVQQMLWDIYYNFDDLQLAEAVRNVIINEVQDRLYGTMGHVGKRAVRHAAREGYYSGGTGLQTGGRYRPGKPDQAPKEQPWYFDYLPNMPSFSVHDLRRSVGWI